MWWKSLLAALLVLPPAAYVAGTLSAPTEAPEQRPALVVDGGPRSPASTRPATTLGPTPPPPRTDGGDDDGDDGEDGDGDEADDADEADDIRVVRPGPEDADDDDGPDDDGRDDD